MHRALLAPVLVVAALIAGAPPGPAGAATDAGTAPALKVSSRALLGELHVRSEHLRGYDRSKFGDWIDADHDGCDTRDEVLIKEAVRRPVVGAGCSLRLGRWRSRYDGVVTTDPSTFDIDHMVPLAEAWQSGAYRWSSGTRVRYANDLGYAADLIAVSAHANRSKGDREPQDWLPELSSYRCRYLANWVAVKWRWHLRINRPEKRFLRHHLSSCSWPTVPQPVRASITLKSATGGSSGDGLDPRFSTCTEAKAHGYGPYYEGRDPEYDWYVDADHDGIVCE